MTNWYWEPATTRSQAAYADRDGTREKPWVLGPNRLGINPGAMDPAVFNPGDTLWVTGLHNWFNFDDALALSGVHDLTVRGPAILRAAGLYDCSGITLMDFDLTTVRLGGGSNHTLDGLVIAGGRNGLDTDTFTNIDNVTIRNCEIYDQSHEGIQAFVNPAFTRDGWVIENNHIYNVGRVQTVPDGDCEGIGLQRTTNSIIRGNHIHHCDYGINLYESGNGACYNVLIANNRIHDINTGPSWWPSRGIMISGGSTAPATLYNITIERNEISSVGREGIRLQAPPGAEGLVCRNNRVWAVNTEFGQRNTEHIVAPIEWALSGNVVHSGATRVVTFTRRR